MSMSTANGSNAEDVALLPQFITHFCTANPEQLVAQVIDVDKDSSLDGTRITAGRLLDDARRAAYHLKASTGLHEDSAINVSILARSGYVYLVNMIGISLNHWTPVLISTRNSLDAIVELVQTSNSRCLFIDETHAATAENVQKQIGMVKVTKLYNPMVEAYSVLRDQQIKLERASGVQPTVNEDHPAFYLHSSGTTGHPKLIPTSHGVFLQRLRRAGEVKYSGRPSLAPVPLFHGMGLMGTLAYPMVMGVFALIIESSKPLTGEVIIQILQRYPGSISLMSPASVLEMLQLGEDAISILTKAHRVMFGGASLPREVGNQLASRGVKLMTLFGTTETGGLAHIDLPSDDLNDWEYFRFRDSPEIVLNPVESHTSTNANVVQLHLKPGEFLPPTFVDPDDPYGFTPGDIFEEHPRIKNLWKHVGRKSSVTVLLNGEKTDNGQLENLLQRDPFISLAVVFGSGRFQNGVILLPTPNNSFKDRNAFLNAVWETVERANTIIPQHSRLVRPLVLMADPSKGFSLTDKGTVRRVATLEMYKDEIDAAYSALESDTSGHASASILPRLDDETAVLQHVRDAVFEVMKKPIGDDEDLFDHDMDSLSALTLRSSLLPIIRASNPNSNAPRTIVYHYPTIARLTAFIISGDVERDSMATKMDRLVEIFSSGISTTKSTSNEPATPGSGLTVLLTGSTGTFGSQVLANLLQNPSVVKVVCLNRDRPSLSMVQRHSSQMDDPGLLDSCQDKIEFATMDISQEGLGLDGGVLEMIRGSVTDIVHCAWDINFNHPMEHFVDTHIAGTKHLAQFALSSKRKTPPRFVFISSIASVGKYHDNDLVPERTFDDPALPLEQGYGQSKFVAERVLNRISTNTGLPVTIVRVGQLSGSTVTGHWNRNEYVFSLLQSSIAIGKIPDWLPDVRWMPTNVAAEALADILHSESNIRSGSIGADVYHLESPAITHGSDLVRWAVELSGGALVPVPSAQWLEAINASTAASASVKTAERLYDFFKDWLDKESSSGTATLSTEKATKVSAAAARCESISRELFGKYYGYAAHSL